LVGASLESFDFGAAPVVAVGVAKCKWRLRAKSSEARGAHEFLATTVTTPATATIGYIQYEIEEVHRFETPYGFPEREAALKKQAYGGVCCMRLRDRRLLMDTGTAGEVFGTGDKNVGLAVSFVGSVCSNLQGRRGDCEEHSIDAPTPVRGTGALMPQAALCAPLVACPGRPNSLNRKRKEEEEERRERLLCAM